MDRHIRVFAKLLFPLTQDKAGPAFVTGSNNASPTASAPGQKQQAHFIIGRASPPSNKEPNARPNASRADYQWRYRLRRGARRRDRSQTAGSAHAVLPQAIQRMRTARGFAIADASASAFTACAKMRTRMPRKSVPGQIRSDATEPLISAAHCCCAAAWRASTTQARKINATSGGGRASTSVVPASAGAGKTRP